MGFAQITGAVVAVAATIWMLKVRREKRPQRGARTEASTRLLQMGQRRLLNTLLDLGGFFGVDIGGSLTKLVFFLPDDALVERMLKRGDPTQVAQKRAKLQGIRQIASFILSRETYGGTGVRDVPLSFHMEELGGTFHFIRFETRRMAGAMRFASRYGLNAGMHTLCATGGGALKFRDAAAVQLGVHLDSRDEIQCLVKGIAFLMAHVQAEAYTFKGAELVDRPSEGIEYPYMLVNVGSGVGFIVVTSEGKWERVSGTSLGGGTFYGLCHMLTGLTSFDDMLDAAECGDNTNVDLTVGDIYGGDYGKFGLKASTIASSFGKAITWAALQGRTRGGSTLAEEDGADQAPDGSFRAIGGPALRRSEAMQVPTSPDRKTVRGRSLSPAREPAEVALPPDTTAPPSAKWGAAASAATAAPASPAVPTDSPTSLASGSAAAATVSPDAISSTAVAASSSSSSSSGSSSGGNGSSNSGSGGDSPEGRHASGVSGSGDDEEAAAAAVGATTARKYAPRDVCRALLIMISNNIGQLAYLNANKHKCKNVYFAGNFLRHENTIAMRTLAYAIHFWSKGSLEGMFLRHEGYGGALGAFLATLEQELDTEEADAAQALALGAANMESS